MTVQEFGMLLLRRWWMVAIAVVIGAGAGFAYESSQPTVVSTHGRLLIGPSLVGDNQIDSTGQLSRSTLQQTLAEITTGSEVTQSARAEVDNTSSDYSVSAVVIPETNVVKVTVDGRSPERTIQLATVIMSHAERVFEERYPVFDVAVVDEPLNAPKVAPDPEFGLVMGGLLGAAGAAIVIAALAGTSVENQRRWRDVHAEPVPRRRRRGHDGGRRRDPAVGIGPPPVDTAPMAHDGASIDEEDAPQSYETETHHSEPFGSDPYDDDSYDDDAYDESSDPVAYHDEPYPDEPYHDERYHDERYHDTEQSPAEVSDAEPVESTSKARVAESWPEAGAGAEDPGSHRQAPPPSPTGGLPADGGPVETPSRDVARAGDDDTPPPGDDGDESPVTPIPLPPSRDEKADARPGRHLAAGEDSALDATPGAEIDEAITDRLPDWLTQDWMNLSAPDTRSGEPDLGNE